jgi:hypothetical protein
VFNIAQRDGWVPGVGLLSLFFGGPQPQEGNVRDIYEVLREKEAAIERVRREVKALCLVTPLLADAGWSIPQPAVSREKTTEPVGQLGEALRTVAPLLVDETKDLDPEVRSRLIEAGENDSKLGRAQKISRQLRHIAAPLLGANLE